MAKVQKPRPRKRTVAIKDLSAKSTAKVKGGFNPQPEPPGREGIIQGNPLVKIITPTNRIL